MSDILSFNYSGHDHQYLSFEYKGQRVLFSNQLANILGYNDTVRIRQNFKRNLNYFIIDEDHFHLVGNELNSFKSWIKTYFAAQDVTSDIHSTSILKILVDNSLKTNELYLWTESGVLNHIKLSSSEESKHLFLIVKKAYFELKAIKTEQALIKVDQNKYLENYINDQNKLLKEYFDQKFDLVMVNNDVQFYKLNNKLKCFSNILFLN